MDSLRSSQKDEIYCILWVVELLEAFDITNNGLDRHLNAHLGVATTPSLYLQGLSPVQTGATLLPNNSQHCWILYVASVCTPFCILLGKVSYVQTDATTPNRQCWELLANNVASVCTRL